MFLKQLATGDLVEVLSLNDLFNPAIKEVVGRVHAGEEMQDATTFAKSGLVFPSGESLPGCWVDAHYRDQALRR